MAKEVLERCHALLKDETAGTHLCRRMHKNLAVDGNGAPIRLPDCPKINRVTGQCELLPIDLNKPHVPMGEKCPNCGSKETDASNIQDVAPSTHYVQNVADMNCEDCEHKWNGAYGYWGVA
jgi:hypothetical protein